MKTKLLLTLAALVLMVTGMKAATPYAVYCQDDQSFHFLTTDAEPQVGATLASNNLPITNVWKIENYTQTPVWHTKDEVMNVTKAVFEPSFSNYKPSNCGYWFYHFEALENIEGLNNLDTSKVNVMCQMFGGCEVLADIDLSSFNTSNVTDMTNMFSNCSKLTSLDLSSFDTQKVTKMGYMFRYCSDLASLDLSKFDTSKVTNMEFMFDGCSGLTSLDLSKFDTSKVTNMKYMFDGCSGLTSLDLGSFDTTNVTNMGSMFRGCSNLDSIALSSFDTSTVTDMSSMFSGCKGLTSLDLTGFDTSIVTSMSSMFSGCSNLTEINLGSDFNTSNVTNMMNLFSGCSGLTSIDLSNFDTTKVTTMWDMFNLCSGLTSLDLSSFQTPVLEFTSGMFYGCTGLISVNVKNFYMDFYNNNMKDMFDKCDNLRLVDMSATTVTDDCGYSYIFDMINENALIYVPDGTEVDEYEGEVRANVVVGGTCEHFVINYGGGSDQNLLSVPYDFTANKVTINRTFAADTPYSLHLPFAMNAIEGGTLYEYTGYTDSTVQFDPVESTEAHTPYMFTPDAELANGIVIDTDVEVKATPAQTADEGEGYIGVYEKKIFTEDDQNSKLYYGWAGNEFRLAGKGASVDACRAYFKLPAGQAAPARISAKFGDGTNRIQSVFSNDAESETPAFNLNGQRVTDSYKGIVIKNGKKILTPAR